MIFIYKITLDILFILSLPFLPFVYFFSEKRRANLAARLGLQKGIPAKKIQEQRIWIPAPSAGEETILLAAYKTLIKKFPALLMIIAPRDPARSKSLVSDFKFSDPGIQKDMGKKCNEVFFLNSGAVQRILKTLERFLSC